MSDTETESAWLSSEEMETVRGRLPIVYLNISQLGYFYKSCILIGRKSKTIASNNGIGMNGTVRTNSAMVIYGYITKNGCVFANLYMVANNRMGINTASFSNFYIYFWTIIAL